MLSGKSSATALAAALCLCLGFFGSDPPIAGERPEVRPAQSQQPESQPSPRVPLPKPKTATGMTSKLFRGAENNAQTVVVTSSADFVGRGPVFVPSVTDAGDPGDPVQRLIILMPGGPFLVDLVATIDGRPFRAARLRLADEMLQGADTNRDGKHTWAEAVKSPRFTLGRLGVGQATAPSPEIYSQPYDRNRDGLVDRAEALYFLAMTTGGHSFALDSSSIDPASRFDVKKLLDADADGVLSADEIKAAPARLQSRDTNQNDLLEIFEISGLADQAYDRVTQVQSMRRTATPANVLAHGVNVDGRTLFDTLKTRYAGTDGQLTAEDFPAVPFLVSDCDLNRDGRLDPAEIVALFLVPPHVVLEFNSGNLAPNLPAGLSLKSMAASLSGKAEAVAAADGQITLKLPGKNLVFAAGDDGLVTQQSASFARNAELILGQYDADKNGYLEKKELETAGNQNFALQFDLWDADGDGKVFASEIKTAYERQQAPLFSMIRASVVELGPAFFTPLDETGDGRLSLREMRSAAIRLASLDKNRDGQITLDEMPGEIRLTFGRGYAAYSGRQVVAAGGWVVTPSGPAPSRGPEWFLRMDRNGDGDLTPREFLGTTEQFDKFDTDKDGFIDRNEAEAAKPTIVK